MTALKWLKMKIRELQSKEENQWHGWVQWSKKTFGSNLNEMNSTQFVLGFSFREVEYIKVKWNGSIALELALKCVELIPVLTLHLSYLAFF